MAKYDVTFSLTAGTGWKTIFAGTAAAARSLFLKELNVGDDIAASTDYGLQFRVGVATSYTGGTAGATPTPLPKGNAGASSFTAATNFSAEPTYTGLTVKHDVRLLPAGSGYVFTFDDPEQEIKAFGTQVIVVQMKSTAARTYLCIGSATLYE